MASQTNGPEEQAAQPRSFEGRETALVAGICLVGLYLRLWHISTLSLWNDEILTVTRAADESWAVLWKRPDFLMYWIQRVFFHILPHTDAFFRLPAVISGVAGVAALYLVGREILNRPAALVASFLLAMAPFHIHYSQEARHYTHLMFLTLFGTWLLIRALKHGHHLDWVGFTCVSMLNVFIHPAVLVVTGLQIVTGLLAGAFFLAEKREEREEREEENVPPRRFLRSIAAPCLICAVVIYGVYALRSPEQVIRILQIAGVVGVEDTEGALKTTAVEFDRLKWLSGSYRLFAGTEYAWLPVVFLIAGLVHTLRYSRGAAVFLILLGILPLPFGAIAPLHWYPYPRYFLWALPFCCLCAANGVVALALLLRVLPLRESRRQTAQAALVCALLAVVYVFGARRILANVYRREKGTDWRRAASLLKDQQLPGEVVLIEGKRLHRQAIRLGLRHYFRFDEVQEQNPPRLLEFPGSDKLDQVPTTATTAWRVHRIPHDRKTAVRIGRGGGVFPGIQVQRFLLASPQPVEIPNGSFELDNGTQPQSLGPSLRPAMYDSEANNSIPDGWYLKTDGSVAVRLDDQTRTQGRRSLRIDIREAQDSCQMLSMPIPAEGGYIYEASCKIRIAGQADLKLSVILLDANLKPLIAKSLNPAPEQDGWSVHRLRDPSGFSECQVTPAGTAAVRLRVRIEKGSRPGTRVWLDDLRLSGAWPQAIAKNQLLRRLPKLQTAPATRPNAR